MLSLVADEYASYTIPSTLHEMDLGVVRAKRNIDLNSCNAMIFCYAPRTGFSFPCTMFLAMSASLEMNAQTLRHLSAPVVLSPNVTLQQWSPIRHFCVQEMFQEDHRLSNVAECLHEARSRWQLGHCCVSLQWFCWLLFFNPAFRAFSRSLFHNFFFVVHQFCTEVSLYALFAQLVADRPFHVLRGCVGVGMDAASLPPR